MSYDTVSAWHSKNTLSASRGYNREYFELLLEHKKVLNEDEIYEEPGKLLTKVQKLS